MSVSVQIGLILAVATALTSIISFLYKHRGAVEAPRGRLQAADLQLASPSSGPPGTRSASSSRWARGASTSAALALAPISLVQSVIAGGLVLLTVLADRLFGIDRDPARVDRRRASRRSGSLSSPRRSTARRDSAHSDYDALTLGIYVAVVAGARPGGRRARARARPRGDPARGASAGLLWGASDVSIKALSASLDDRRRPSLHPLTLVILSSR